MTKQQRLYGKLVVDFANTTSSDDACLKTLENIQDVFEFPSSFAERAKKVFPAMSSQPQIKSKILWEKQNEIIRSIKNGLDYQYELQDVDYIKQTVTLAELHSVRSDEWDPDAGEPKEISIREIAEISDKIDPETVEQLVEVWNHMYLLSGHEQIDSIRKALRYLLEQVIEGENLYKNHLIKELLSVYDEMSKPKLAITKYGALIEKHAFSQDSYLAEEAWQSPEWPRLYVEPLANCLVNFLRSDDSTEHIRRCEECHKYWVTKTKRAQKYCSETCKNRHHNRKRIESGEHAAYKRRRRKEGAPESYYG